MTIHSRRPGGTDPVQPEMFPLVSPAAPNMSYRSGSTDDGSTDNRFGSTTGWNNAQAVADAREAQVPYQNRRYRTR